MKITNEIYTLKLGRKAYGSEINKESFAIAKNKFKDF